MFWVWSKWLLVAYRSRREVGTPAPVTSPLLHALACSLCHYRLYNGHPQYYICTYVLDAIGSLLQLLVCSQCHNISMINVIYWEPFLSPTTFPWMVILHIYFIYYIKGVHILWIDPYQSTSSAVFFSPIFSSAPLSVSSHGNFLPSASSFSELGACAKVIQRGLEGTWCWIWY